MGLRFKNSSEPGRRYSIEFSGNLEFRRVQGYRIRNSHLEGDSSPELPGTALYYEKMPGSSPVREAVIPEQGKKGIKNGFLSWLLRKRSYRYFYSSLKYYIKGRHEKALGRLKRALQNDEDLTDACFILALLTDSREERLIAINRALENRADYGEFFEKYGIWLRGELSITGDVRLRLTNDLCGLYLLAGEVLQENGELPEAVKLLEESGLLHIPEIRLLLGEIYCRSGRYDQSIRLLQGMGSDDTAGTIALLLLGIAFREKGLTRAAVENLRKARRSNRDRPESLILEARYQLGITLEMEGKKYLARREYEKILSENFDYQDVRDKLDGVRQGFTEVKNIEG